MQVFPFKLRK